MSKESTKRAAHLAAILMREFPAAHPHLVANAVVLMQLEAKRSQSRGVRLCNVGGDNDAALKRDKAGEKRAVEALANAGIGTPGACEGFNFAWVELGGDPRGTCGALRIRGRDGAEIRGDGFGDGFAIY